MQRFLALVFLLAWTCCLAGCGSGVVVQGKIKLDGQPFTVAAEEQVMVLFLDMKEEGATQQKSFPASVQADGSFTLRTPDGQGLPPGKYRVSVSLFSKSSKRYQDKFQNVYNPKTSPLIVEISSSSPNPTLELQTAK